MEELRRVAPQGRAPNYDEDSVFRAYFMAREYASYYTSLLHVGPRREFRPSLIPVLERVVELSRDKTNFGMLQALISRAQQYRPRSTEHSTAARTVMEQEPLGWRLLELPPTFDFDQLKDHYRKAAKKYHPDLGGTHEQMLSINAAYEAINEYLCAFAGNLESDESGFDEPLVKPRSFDSFLLAISVIIMDSYLDDWAVDLAAEELQAIMNSPSFSRLLQHNVNYQFHLIESANTIAKRMCAASRIPEASAAAQIAVQMAQWIGEVGPQIFADQERIQAMLQGREKLRVVLNHPVQIQNAYRLRIIDDAQYSKMQAKIGTKIAETERLEDELERILAAHHFIGNLPLDRGIAQASASGGLVPQTGYFETDIRMLTRDQQAEYSLAFGSHPTLKLVRKYAFVRLFSLLHALVWHAEEIDLRAIGEEARLLSKVHGKEDYYCAQVAEFASLLIREGHTERNVRLSILRSEDSKGAKPRYERGRFTMTISGGDDAMRVDINPEYLDWILSPVSSLSAPRDLEADLEGEDY